MITVYDLVDASFYVGAGQKYKTKLQSKNFLKEIIVTSEGDVIGCGLITGFEKFYKLNFVAVDINHRGKNIGKQIVNTAVEFTKENKATIVWATTVPLFYEKIGFYPFKKCSNGYFSFKES